MKLTAEKKRKAKHAMQKRLRGEDPFPVPQGKLSGPVVPKMTRGAGTKVAFVLANQLEAGLTAVSVQTGNQRCHTAELVVADTLAPLLRSEAGVHHMSVCDAIYIIGLGLKVTSTKSWQGAAGHPSRLTQQELVGHQAMVRKAAVDIAFSKALAEARPEVYKALKLCCKAWKGKWRLRQAGTAPEVGQWFGNEQDIWMFLRNVRRVINYSGPKLAKQATGLDVV